MEIMQPGPAVQHKQHVPAPTAHTLSPTLDPLPDLPSPQTISAKSAYPRERLLAEPIPCAHHALLSPVSERRHTGSSYRRERVEIALSNAEEAQRRRSLFLCGSVVYGMIVEGLVAGIDSCCQSYFVLALLWALLSCSHSLLSRRSRALRPPLLIVWLLMAGEEGVFSELLGVSLSVELRSVVRKLLSLRAVDLILNLSVKESVSIEQRHR